MMCIVSYISPVGQLANVEPPLGVAHGEGTASLKRNNKRKALWVRAFFQWMDE